MHAGINHLLCMYICFSSCGLSEYHLVHSGNQQTEAIHGMFPGGTSSLLISSPNLSFREFLEKMNTAQEIRQGEQLQPPKSAKYMRLKLLRPGWSKVKVHTN